MHLEFSKFDSVFVLLEEVVDHVWGSSKLFREFVLSPLVRFGNGLLRG